MCYELKKLKEYDAENRTELYKTLMTYILNERNTVATASDLYVGRSTLFYRLRKIKEITGLDNDHLARPGKNLYLRLSIFFGKLWREDNDGKLRREMIFMLTPKQNLLETLKERWKTGMFL